MASKDRFLPVHRFLPLKGLPQAGLPINGEHDVQYRFNSLGYRCPEFDAQAEIRIVSIGCSYVFGTGLAQEHIFHERFATELRAQTSKSVVNWNLGLASASNDYIARLLLLAVPRLDPDIVLVNFTHLARREYISIENRQIHYNPSYAEPTDEITTDILGHLSALSNPQDDRVDFFKNYKIVEMMSAGRCLLFSAIAACELEPLAPLMDLRRFVGPLRTVDRAHDDRHPGPESHKILAALYWDKFVELDGLQSISRRKNVPATSLHTNSFVLS